MNKKETTELLKRIKRHYQDKIVVDDYTVEEWLNLLKDYTYSEVNERLTKHLQNEEWCKYPPKPGFLINYLTKEKDKDQEFNYDKKCTTCGEMVSYKSFDAHWDRCSSINFIERKMRQHFKKQINVEELKQLSQDDFNDKYLKFLHRIKDADGKDRHIIKNLIYLLENPNEPWYEMDLEFQGKKITKEVPKAVAKESHEEEDLFDLN